MPITLRIITKAVSVNIIFLLLIEIFPKKDVIFESLSSLMFILLFETKPNSVGNRVKVIINDVINPKVIIQPKSIMGLMPLNIKDKKAQTVVNTV